MSVWKSLLGRGRHEADLRKELSFHIEERVSDLIRSGLTGEAARRRVRQEFGGLDQVQEQCRDVRPGRWLERLTADIRYSLRGMRQKPVLALTILLTVAVCVAVNTAVFTVVDSLLIRPLPFPQADRLIAMANQYPRAGVADQEFSAAGDYVDRQGTLPAVAEQALYQFPTYPIEHSGATAQMRGLAVTPSFFPLLRILPAQGRLFTGTDSEPGKDRVVIVTDGLWRELLGSGPVLGQALRINGLPYTVIGVLPAGFRFLAPDVRYVLPLALNAEERRARHTNNYHYLARLRDGATVAQAQEQVNVLNARLLDELPELKRMLIDAGFHTRVEALQPWLMRHVQTNLRLLWAGALLVLLVGAANLAGLALARAHGQMPELATRLALGATRADIIRRSLVDGALPALFGGVLGLAGGALALRLWDRELLPGAAEIAVSPAVAFYAFAGALLAGVVAGLVPLIALRGAQVGGTAYLSSRGNTVRGLRLRRGFVTAQTMAAFLLVYCAAILMASLGELMRVNPGFRVADIWTASTFLPAATYPERADMRSAMDRIVPAIRNLPGVESVGGASDVPFSTGYDDNVILAEGYVMQPGESVVSPNRLNITPGYLETLGLKAIHGRLFDGRDTNESFKVVLVDEKLARRFWPGQDPVGRRMYYPGAKPGDSLTVIGVVRSIRLEDLAGSGNLNGIYYIPWSQAPRRKVSVAWQGSSESVAAVRQEFSRLTPGCALFDVRSMQQRQEQTLSARRATEALVLVFAGVTVLLAAIGINGLLAFLVAQRRREIGIRLAIGSRPVQVFGRFLTDGAMLTALGLIGGVGIAVLLRPWLTHQIYGVAALEPTVLAAAAGLVGIVSLGAVALPALRAARLDPLEALRE